MTADLLGLIALNTITFLAFLYFAIFLYPYRELSQATRSRPRTFISNALFREFWLFVTNPVKNYLQVRNVSPNVVTLAGVLISGIAGVGYALEWFGFAGWMIIIGASCDMIDGQMARERGLSRKSGAFFDSTLDRVGEFLIAAGLLWLFRDEPFWFMATFLFTAAAQMTSYTRARAEGLGCKGNDGLFQRPERMIILCVATPFVPVLDLTALSGIWLLKLAVLICLIGSTVTAFSRWFSAYREIETSERGLQ